MAVEKELRGEKPNTTPSKKRAFVITPIGASGSPERRHADWVLNAAIKPIFEPAGYEVFRSDTIDDPSMINDAIFNHIFHDEVCIADLSFTNANVYYELGVRHTVLLPVIHIAHELVDRIPFDNAQHRAIFFNLDDWHSIERLKDGLLKQLKSIEAAEFTISNPITHARGRIRLSESGDAPDKMLAGVLERIDRLENEVRGPVETSYDFGKIEWGPDTQFRNSIASRNKNRRNATTMNNRLIFPTHFDVENLGLEIIQFMSERGGVASDEAESDFRKEFGDKLISMSVRAREQLYSDIMSISGIDNFIDADWLLALITYSAHKS